MLSSGVNRSDSATAFGAGLIYCSSWGSGNGKFLMFWSIYKVTLTGRSEVINTSFLVRCFRLWGSSREAPAGWGPPVPRHPGALQHPPLGSGKPDRPTEAAAHTLLRTTRMVVNVSQYTPNKKSLDLHEIFQYSWVSPSLLISAAVLPPEEAQMFHPLRFSDW